MKKNIRLTEGGLVRLVKKVLKEQDNRKFEKLFYESSATGIRMCPSNIKEELKNNPFEMTTSDKTRDYVIVHWPKGFCATQMNTLIKE